MNKILNLVSFLVILLLFSACNQTKKTTDKETSKTKKPNIVIVYCDDLGYGDLSCYDGIGLKTPNIDALASSGAKFTNGYATSATCSPSRFGLLTGTYPWRNKNAKILPGTAPLLISTAQPTLPKILKTVGYQTAVIGKWHLGLGDGNVNWNERIKPCPNEVGFDYSFIMAATQDRVPTVYIKNGNVVNLDPNDPIEVSYKHNFDNQPTGKKNPELCTKMMWNDGHNGTIVNGIGRIGYMKGGEKAKWVDEDMAEVFLGEVKNYLKSHKDKPFFLYYAMQQPHVPRTPGKRFAGKSGLGPRGDVILEADWCFGEFMKTLKEEGLVDNTLIIFSSDNGPVLDDGYDDFAVEKLGDHKPWGPLRGGKYSLFEAGCKVPFITNWKNVIKPQVNNALICQMDLLSSLGKLTGATVPMGLDSKDLLPVLLGDSDKGRKELITEATTRTALRYENWIMIPPYKGPALFKNVNIESGNSKDYQLYNIKDDVGQAKNLAKENPEKLKQLVEIYNKLRNN